MDWLIQSDATDNYLAIASPPVLSGDFELHLKFRLDSDSIFHMLVGKDSGSGSGNNFIRINSNHTSIRFRLGGSSLNFNLNFTFVAGEIYELRFKRVGTTVDITDDNDVSVVSSTLSSSQTFELWGFFRSFTNLSQVFSGGLLFAKLYDSNSTLIHNWDAAASDHSGSTDQPVLTDTVGGNNATGTNFPSFDPSVWVALGGGGLTIIPTGIASTISFGSPNVITGQILQPNGITSTNTFGSHNVITGAVVTPTGVGSTNVFGNSVIAIGSIIEAIGIASTTVFGTPNIVAGTQYLIPVGIDPTSDFGIAEIKNTVQFLNVLGIDNNTKVGNPIILGGEVVLVNIYTRPITRLIFKKVNRPSVRNK